jgi:hypothetical protein
VQAYNNPIPVHLARRTRYPVHETPVLLLYLLASRALPVLQVPSSACLSFWHHTMTPCAWAWGSTPTRRHCALTMPLRFATGSLCEQIIRPRLATPKRLLEQALLTSLGRNLLFQIGRTSFRCCELTQRVTQCVYQEGHRGDLGQRRFYQ